MQMRTWCFWTCATSLAGSKGERRTCFFLDASLDTSPPMMLPQVSESDPIRQLLVSKRSDPLSHVYWSRHQQPSCTFRKKKQKKKTADRVFTYLGCWRMEDDAARELLQQLKALHYLEDNTAPTRWHRCLITLYTETNAIVLEPLPNHLFFWGGNLSQFCWRLQ